jgi:hypothetical protein
MIDPQLQGIVWVKEKESTNNLQITRLGNSKLLSTMERALESGWSVMIENLQERPCPCATCVELLMCAGGPLSYLCVQEGPCPPAEQLPCCLY